MNELMNIENRNTLTSLDIAEITGKEHKNILSDRFGVASYRDVKRKDLKNALLYVQNWIEKAELRNWDGRKRENIWKNKRKDIVQYRNEQPWYWIRKT